VSEYTAAPDGIDRGARVHHVNTPSIQGTVIRMTAFTAVVDYDNGIIARQSIGVLRAVRR
jgi:hypothetical protein